MAKLQPPILAVLICLHWDDALDTELQMMDVWCNDDFFRQDVVQILLAQLAPTTTDWTGERRRDFPPITGLFRRFFPSFGRRCPSHRHQARPS